MELIIITINILFLAFVGIILIASVKAAGECDKKTEAIIDLREMMYKVDKNMTKPCPFCGGDTRVNLQAKSCEIICRKCDFAIETKTDMSDEVLTHKAAVRSWNGFYNLVKGVEDNQVSGYDEEECEND